MAENPETTHSFDPQFQTENIAFDVKELVACGSCGRKNPPNRRKCIYCAGELEPTTENAASIQPNLRRLEMWERGLNVIVSERTELPDADVEQIVHLLGIEKADAAKILEAGASLPIARLEHEKDAASLAAGLESFGLRCSLVSDTDLAPEKPPVRLGRIDMSEAGFSLTNFNTGQVTEIKTNDLALIIPGLITSSKVDTLEKKGRRGNTKVIDESATASDEPVLDIYSRHDPVGFRVQLAGFDFSTLGDDKGLLAAENLRLLIVRLKEHAPDAKLVNDYAVVRPALSLVWEIELRKDSQGLMRTGFGKREFGSISSTSNLNQFTKYSRLQWHLL